jgi:hypothetical protein
MEIYKNLSGLSNVGRYEFGDEYIDVEFKGRNKDGCNTYRYGYARTGQSNVEHMKELAHAGRGLNSFIVMHVKKLYERKW